MESNWNMPTQTMVTRCDDKDGTLFISNAPSDASDVRGQRECALRAAAARWVRRLPLLLSPRLRGRHRPYLHPPLARRVRPQNYTTARGCCEKSENGGNLELWAMRPKFGYVAARPLGVQSTRLTTTCLNFHAVCMCAQGVGRARVLGTKNM